MKKFAFEFGAGFALIAIPLLLYWFDQWQIFLDRC